MFFLRELPTLAMLKGYRKRFPEMNIMAVNDALHMLRKSSLLLRELESYFNLYGLSQTRFLAMIILDREHDKRGLAAKTVAERLDISKPVVTKTLQSLEKNKFIKITKNEEDGRGKWIKLTDNGRRKLDALLPGYFKIIDKAMS